MNKANSSAEPEPKPNKQSQIISTESHRNNSIKAPVVSKLPSPFFHNPNDNSSMQAANYSWFIKTTAPAPNKAAAPTAATLAWPAVTGSVGAGPAAEVVVTVAAGGTVMPEVKGTPPTLLAPLKAGAAVEAVGSG